MAKVSKYTVVPRLPKRIEKLLEVANNLWWTWDHEAIDLFHRMEPDLWISTLQNPRRMLGEISQFRLDELAKDDYVRGATVFTSGAPADWANFDVDEISHWLPGATVPVPPQEDDPMPEDPRIQQLLDQNALITAALIDFRHGRFTGAEGMDGKIVALNGGVLPEGWAPSYPPLA